MDTSVVSKTIELLSSYYATQAITLHRVLLQGKTNRICLHNYFERKKLYTRCNLICMHDTKPAQTQQRKHGQTQINTHHYNSLYFHVSRPDAQLAQRHLATSSGNCRSYATQDIVCGEDRQSAQLQRIGECARWEDGDKCFRDRECGFRL